MIITVDSHRELLPITIFVDGKIVPKATYVDLDIGSVEVGCFDPSHGFSRIKTRVLYAKNVKAFDKNGGLIGEYDGSIKNVTVNCIYNRCNEILGDRGAEYESSKDQEERSFAAVAASFNAKTGKDLTPAHICLILSDLKDVRQFSQDRLHQDSILDGVNYKALMGVELFKQYNAKEIDK